MKNKEIVQQIIKFYQSGMNYTEVGQELGLSADVVRYWLKKEGIPQHNNGRYKDLIVTRQMAKLYYNGMTLEEVGLKFGLTRQGVRHRFIIAGITRREKVKPVDKDVLEKLYNEDKLPISEIANRLSVGKTQIKNRLEAYQIPKRARIKNGGYIVDFLRSLAINEQKVFECYEREYFVSWHSNAKQIGVKVKTKRLTPNKYAVTRIG